MKYIKYIIMLMLIFNNKIFTETRIDFDKLRKYKYDYWYDNKIVNIDKKSYLFFFCKEGNVYDAYFVNNCGLGENDFINIKNDKYKVEMVINIGSNLIEPFVNKDGKVPYYDKKTNSFIGGYKPEGDIYFANKNIMYKSNVIVNIYPQDIGNNREVYGKKIEVLKDKVFYVLQYDSLQNDLYVYDCKSNKKKLLGNNIFGYAVLNDNTILVSRGIGGAPHFSGFNLYLIDYDGNILKTYKQGETKLLYFDYAAFLEGNLFVMSGKYDNQEGLFLLKYSFEDKDRKITGKKLKDEK